MAPSNPQNTVRPNFVQVILAENFDAFREHSASFTEIASIGTTMLVRLMQELLARGEMAPAQTLAHKVEAIMAKVMLAQTPEEALAEIKKLSDASMIHSTPNDGPVN